PPATQIATVNHPGLFNRSNMNARMKESIKTKIYEGWGLVQLANWKERMAKEDNANQIISPIQIDQFLIKTNRLKGLLST
ncbi:MAG TPA: hypothetical protein VLH15_02600, partial [Dehalococcoidales bacterium]|nr:hypothetical protein [Dehalococcoidales bacterium]